MRSHTFFDPDIERLAKIAADIEATMTYLSTAAENAALTTLTGTTYAAFLAINTGVPIASNTPQNEITAGGTVSLTVASCTTTATSGSAGTGTFTTASAHGLSTGNSVSFTGLTGTGWTTLNSTAGSVNAFVVTVTSTTTFTIAMAQGTYATNPSAGSVYIGYNRVGITWGAAASGSVANSNTLVSNIPASTTISYFSTFAQITGTGGNGYVFGGSLSSITFPSAGTVTVAIGGLVESAS